MDKRNTSDMPSDAGNRSLVCDYVKGLLPARLVAEVNEKLASEPLFAAEVDYYKALYEIIALITDVFGNQNQDSIDVSIEKYYKNTNTHPGEWISFSELLEEEYEYRSLENTPIHLEEIGKTIHKINILKRDIVLLENTIFDRYGQWIPDYINGNIDSTNRQLIEELAGANPLFKQELEHQRELAYTVRRMEREALKLQLAKLRPEPITAVSVAQASKIDRSLSSYDIYDSESKGSRRTIWRMPSTNTSIAAAILLVVGSAALFYFYSGSGSKQDVADKQAMNPGLSIPSSSSDTAADTVVPNDFKTGTAVPDQLWLERKMAVNTFKFTGENFGFAGNKELTVKLFLLQTKSGSDAQASYYVYVSSTVSLYLDDTSTVSLYSISQEDLELAEEKMKAGLYLYMNDNFYLLIKDGNRHYLQPVNPIQSAYLKQNL